MDTLLILDGYSNLSLNAIIVEDLNLYGVIWHRNHLKIMSSVSLLKTNNTFHYNFFENKYSVFGDEDAHKELATDIWGMVAGDANGDGLINTSDIDSIWINHAGE